MSMSMPSGDEAATGGTSDASGGDSLGGRRRGKKLKVSPKVATLKGRKRSTCWNNFTEVKVTSKITPGETETKAKCKYCHSLYAYKAGGATTHLVRHMNKCTPYLNQLAKKRAQAVLNFTAEKGDSDIPLIVTPSEYNHEETRKLIAKMIIVHEYPFRMVEHTWFNVVMRYLNPSYQFIGRKTIRSECLKVFHSEKENLMKSIRSVEVISLTCDLWTSNQNLCYMALVAHYIDKNWTMQCRVLNFAELDPPHTGNVIGQAIFDCLAEWKIEDKVITITLDNASNNDTAVKGLKAKLAARRSSCYNAKYFHVCCCAHIINLIVNDGLAPLASLTKNIRSTVKYIKKSPSRIHKFLEICRNLAMELGEGLKLDVTTRWSSTYHMLRTCIAYQQALDSYAETYLNYEWKPSPEEWDLYASIEPILGSLAEVTTAFSGSIYPTANIFYPHIVNVKVALRDACASQDANLKNMGKAMLDKFDKYWNVKNNAMVLATVLDPRYKLRFIEWCFKKIYATDFEKELAEVRTELNTLYDKFEKEHREKMAASKGRSLRASSSVSTSDINKSLPSVSSNFQSYLQSSSEDASKSEMLLYLDERNEDLANKAFDLLVWWKLNAHRYPVVSMMAKNFLTIPASSVSSESTFSAGGRVLSDYRSSLRPTMVEALICASSWIRGASMITVLTIMPCIFNAYSLLNT